VRSPRFLLYPTYEHQKPHLIRESYQHWLEKPSLPIERVNIEYAAEVVEERLIIDEQQLSELMPFHIGTPLFAAERLHWKRQQPLHALLLRVYRLSSPLTIAVQPEHLGCKSWLDLGGNHIEWGALQPVLDEQAFATIRQQFLQAD
jgi:hypothetical protein